MAVEHSTAIDLANEVEFSLGGLRVKPYDGEFVSEYRLSTGVKALDQRAGPRWRSNQSVTSRATELRRYW